VFDNSVFIYPHTFNNIIYSLNLLENDSLEGIEYKRLFSPAALIKAKAPAGAGALPMLKPH
jgi:hypothetical protein